MEQDVFEVIFLDDDKITVLDRQFAKLGESVSYKGEIPVKEPTTQETYTFCGWTNEEKLQNVTEKIILIAKYTVDVKKATKDAMYNASLENAQETNLSDAVNSGKKLDSQQKAIEKDSRTASEIVSDIMKNGKTEIGQDVNKDNIDR